MKTTYKITAVDTNGNVIEMKASTWGRAASTANVVINLCNEVTITAVQTEDAPKPKSK